MAFPNLCTFRDTSQVKITAKMTGPPPPPPPLLRQRKAPFLCFPSNLHFVCERLKSNDLPPIASPSPPPPPPPLIDRRPTSTRPWLMNMLSYWWTATAASPTECSGPCTHGLALAAATGLGQGIAALEQCNGGPAPRPPAAAQPGPGPQPDWQPARRPALPLSRPPALAPSPCQSCYSWQGVFGANVVHVDATPPPPPPPGWGVIVSMRIHVHTRSFAARRPLSAHGSPGLSAIMTGKLQTGLSLVSTPYTALFPVNNQTG